MRLSATRAAKQSRQMGRQHQLAQAQIGSQSLAVEPNFYHCSVKIQAQTWFLSLRLVRG
jgi:hypothetical protein